MLDTGAPAANDGQTNEETMLLAEIDHDIYHTAESTESECGQLYASEEDESEDDDEINKPWPATFERSAEILAKPIVGTELVVKATESMHILPPTKLRKNTKLTYLNRGYRTPDPRSKIVAGERDNVIEDEDEEGGVFQRMGLAKMPSLDWRLRPGGPAVLSEKQQKSLEEMKALKQKILGKMKDQGDAADSKEELNGKDSKQEMDDSSKTDFIGSVCNVSNTLLGIGILSLPFVFRMAGWVGGLFSMLTFGAVTWWTSILLGRQLNGDPRPNYLFEPSFSKNTHNNHKKHLPSRLRKPIKSFPAIAREAFGQKGTILLSSVMYFELFSCLAVFLVSMGDHLQTLFPNISLTIHMIIVSILLVGFTALLKTPRLISYLSTVGTCTTVSVVVAVVLTALWKGDISSEIAQEKLQQPNPTQMYTPPYHTAWITTGLPIGYGLVAFCFSGHTVIPTIYTSMKCPHKFEKMVSTSYALTMVCCIMVAASGYYMFGSTVSDQITISLAEAPGMDEAAEMKVLTWLMIFTVFSKFCLYIFPLALGVEEIIAPLVPTDQALEVSYTLIKFSLIVSALAVAVFVPAFGFLCSLVGLICSMMVSVIFPAAAHLKLFGPHLPLWEKIVNWMFVIGGLVFGVVGTIATIQ